MTQVMIQTGLDFVDPTIPGVSGRDLIRPTSRAIEASTVGRGGATPRQDYARRKALAGLDRHLLRDLGLERDAI